MGAHPRAPSRVALGGVTRSLADVIDEQPIRYLGRDYASNRALPYLFKVLAAAQPLSIQCHPDDAQAQAGFDREDSAGIPRGAAHRLYPDPTAKPELVVAQSRFVGLKGFRTVEQTRSLLNEFGLGALAAPDHLEAETATRATFQHLMRSTSADREKWLAIALDRASTSQRPEARWMHSLAERYPNDAGVLAPLVLNLIELEPEQALFLQARELHAYLEGTALELMANSDNVLRGGLTKKHVDVDELLRVLDFTPRQPHPVEPREDANGWLVYSTPTPQFNLRCGRLICGRPLQKSAPVCMEVLLCTEGQARIDGDPEMVLGQGESAAVSADTGAYTITGNGIIYIATVGPS